jgi:hypothetical protein
MRLSFLRTLCATAILAVVALLGMAQPARATFEIILSDGIAADTQTIVDNANTGTITLNNTIGVFQITGSATAPPKAGTSGAGFVMATQNTFNVQAIAGGGTLKITLDLTNLATNGTAVTLVSSISDSALSQNAMYSFQSYLISNLGTSTTGLQGPFTGANAIPALNTNANSQSQSVNVPSGPQTFEIQNVLTFTPSQANDVLTDTGTTVVDAQAGSNVGLAPAPSSGVLAFIGIPVVALGFLARRRMTRKLPAAA